MNDTTARFMSPQSVFAAVSKYIREYTRAIGKSDSVAESYVEYLEDTCLPKSAPPGSCLTSEILLDPESLDEFLAEKRVDGKMREMFHCARAAVSPLFADGTKVHDGRGQVGPVLLTTAGGMCYVHFGERVVEMEESDLQCAEDPDTGTTVMVRHEGKHGTARVLYTKGYRVTVALNYNYGRIETVPITAVAPVRDDAVTTWPPGALRSESNSACTVVSVGDTVRFRTGDAEYKGVVVTLDEDRVVVYDYSGPLDCYYVVPRDTLERTEERSEERAEERAEEEQRPAKRMCSA